MNAELIFDREAEIAAAQAAMLAAHESGEAAETRKHWERMCELINQRTPDEIRALELERFGRIFK